MKPKVLVVEPFYGGSHKQLIDFISTLPIDIELISLPAKKWHWRARTSALHLSQVIPTNISRNVLFCSSVLNLSELLSLRPDLNEIEKKIVYFHENQLNYPVQEVKERDFQFGYNQITTCLVADQVWFNSKFNRDSFLDKLGPFFKIQPEFRPNISEIKEKILEKSKIMYFPVMIPKFCQRQRDAQKPLHILWPHRWEHDKNPEAFFNVLFQLQDEKESFKLSILGENFQEIPPIFQTAKEKLSKEIVHFGWLERKEDYFKILAEADVVISTSNHEYFGVAMIEAAASGCLPLVPNRLVYPELYPAEPCVYRTDNQLFKKLKNLCKRPHMASKQWTEELAANTCEQFSCRSMSKIYLENLQ